MIQPAFMVGVTGTNGKTSVTQWIAQALTLGGRKCAIVGTLGNGFPGALVPGPNTTPGAHVLREFLPECVRQGAQACAMEVSSIGLHQNRVAGLRFDVAVFTNLTRDHLEYHGTMAAYAAEKAKLFDWPGLSCAVLNLDDPFGRELAAKLAGRVPTIGYTLGDEGGADRVLRAMGLTETASGLAFSVDGVAIFAPVIGRFNASNLLAVIGTLLAAGMPLPTIAAALAQITAPPGRMQPLGGGPDDPLVIVDYAHSPDALEKVLTTLRGTANARGGRLVCVFGCGGERDPGKRPQMGKIAEALADRVVVTSDNPRGEEPLMIIDQIVAGMRSQPVIEPDRARAVAATLAAAAPNDVILIAGKGHEPHQEINGARIPFSDIECAKSALARRHEVPRC
ncbi:UDP-N-acetylmuramoyl-L-alanyl-D-glutamate--2,6-diaminopimelate ligase [Sulfuricystis multivorans]|uniref:UDP-N-acetylmuramoyl-L-alanyl-D-glutamate--2, 6-diaminopimelate ligase n=1 Tax=Sulfuricystis multivorans TaxID=2211108 RepID=UPI0024E02B6B|nr:UDP-N-acetylmuramoyl-L-alanyl-D-glutamate--2,6-diaminopimelate ligase [Sulfuricystis multivorans]